MGICLDTEQKNEESETTDEERSRVESAWAGRVTPPTASFPMQNASHVKFEPPNVPVIFVLGGPGSGKVTHCDNLMQERRGVVHINMTDLLQQYAIGNDMQDFGTLSSKTVTEVLMLEMKMAPTARTYLVSGYPRSMRDVAEYSDKSLPRLSAMVQAEARTHPVFARVSRPSSCLLATAGALLALAISPGGAVKAVKANSDLMQKKMIPVLIAAVKIQTINGVVLVSWRQRVLERQIEYGARLGHVVLSLARMELANFYRSVMPVADYFDQSNMLIAVNGERNPEEVYRDFRAAVLKILSTTEDQSSVNGVSGVGVGASGIPGEIVGVEPAPAQETAQEEIMRRGDERVSVVPVVAIPIVPAPAATAVPVPVETRREERIQTSKTEVIRVRGESTTPAVVWVVGGPGSNKASLCQRSVSQRQGWTYFSLGQRLRTLADAGGKPASDSAIARTAVSGGELAPQELATRLVRTAVADAARTGSGLVLDGYPRDLEQMVQFETEYRVTPRMVLLDCSKLQLGRGRRDDSVAAFRRRLEVFRELSLPMLKTLDRDHRLVIVDGDTDSPEVQAEFSRVLLDEMEKAELIAAIPQSPSAQNMPRTDMSSVQQFAAAVSRMGGALANGHANGGLRNGSLQNGGISNGFLGMSNKVLVSPKPGKTGDDQRTKIPTVSQLTHDDVRVLYEQSTGDVTIAHM